jgi:hypothetical protein
MEMGLGPRNLVETTPQKEPFLTYCHPEMQEALLAEAERAGAEVRRGVMVEAVEPRCRINASEGDSAEWKVGRDRAATGGRSRWARFGSAAVGRIRRGETAAGVSDCWRAADGCAQQR